MEVIKSFGLEAELATISDVKEQRNELREELQESVKLAAERLAAGEKVLGTAMSNVEATATGTDDRAAAEQAVDAAQKDRDEAKKAHDSAVQALKGTTKPTLAALKVLKGAVSGQFADFTFFAMRAPCWQKVIIAAVGQFFGKIGTLLATIPAIGVFLEYFWSLAFGVALNEWMTYHAIVSSLRVRGKKYTWHVNYFQYLKMRWWKTQLVSANERCGLCCPGKLVPKSDWPGDDGFDLPAGMVGAGNVVTRTAMRKQFKQEFVYFHIEMSWLKVGNLVFLSSCSLFAS
jgi:hypothetical protein